MSSTATPTPQLVIPLAHVTVYHETPHKEVATAPEGIVTESFGPTQVSLSHPHVITHLTVGQAYEIRATTPHSYDAKNLIYVRKLENGNLLFRAPEPKA
ncbi:MAG: hypothetical protein WBY44_35225 [Bryobacteraceae bacterium]|jgi:hypothetical protein